jgi:adenylate cyclase
MGERRVAGRRLAAILAADVAGYSRLIRADEEGTIARLRILRRELIDPAIDAHSGRIIKTMGDGLLIEFASVVDAVRCAVTVQRGMVSRNEVVPEAKRIIFRVGINLGDVVIESDGDLMGDGINVASRLEGLAVPGGICLSGAAYEQVRDKLALPFDDMGEQVVKSIDRPVHAYGLGHDTIAELPEETLHITSRLSPRRVPIRAWATLAACMGIALLAIGLWIGLVRSKFLGGTAAPSFSVVVLPFANLSNDPKQEYFADGITEEVTTAVSRIRGSFVIAHSTANTYKNKSTDARQIAIELGVRYVVEGSVQHQENVVKTSVQFIDGVSGDQLWADRFEGNLTNIFDLQNQIASRIANSVRLEMIRVESRQPAHANVGAQDYVMQGWALRAKAVTKENLEEAQRIFERALALNSKSADAWSGLSYALGQEEVFYPDSQRTTKLKRGEDAADKAIELDPNSAEAHLARGLILVYERRLAEAGAEMERAITLDPSLFRAYAGLGTVEVFRGNPEKAIPLYQQAIRLSPHDPIIAVWYGAIGWNYLLMGNDKAAIEWGLKSRTVDPNYASAYVVLASAYALEGDDNDARAALAEARRLNPSLTIRLLRNYGSTEPAYVKLAERWLDGLRQAGLPEQ